jgi:outer membrane receptor protein involved in Fe transport
MSMEELLQVKVAEVTTASKRLERVTEAPGTVIVIDRRRIQLRGYATLQDVLRDLPGMETIEHYFSEIGTLVPVRGIAGNNKIVVLVNGMRVNPPGGEFFPMRNDISVRDAEQIEVVYGPGSTLYGQDAILAVINIKTRQPRDGCLADAGVAGGAYRTGEGWATYGRTLGPDGAVRLSGHVRIANSALSRLDRHYPAWWSDYAARAEPKGSGIPPDRLDYGLNLFGRVETDDSSVQVWHRASQRSSSEGFNPILGYVPEARWEDRTTAAEARNVVALSERVDLQSAVTVSQYEIDPRSRYVFPKDETSWFLNDFKYGVGSGASMEETLVMRLLPRFDLLAGAVASTFDIVPKATVPGGADPRGDVSAEGGSFVYYTEQGNPASRQEIRRAVNVRYQTYAAYAEGAWRLTDRVKSIAGVRVTDDTRFEENPVTPRASLVWDPVKRLTAKYTYAEAYVAPAPYFAHAPFDNGTRLATANPDIEPEKARSHELTLTHTLDSGSLNVSLYYGEQDNLLIVADAGVPENILQDPVYLEDGGTRALATTVNGGRSHNMGVDVYGDVRLGDVNPWFSYSYVDYEETIGDMRRGLRGISRHNGRLGATWAVTPKLAVTPSLVVRSRPENVKPGRLDAELNAPWEVNVYALYRLTRRVETFLDVRNATDNRYALGSFVGDAVPQETFRAVAGVRTEL